MKFDHREEFTIAEEKDELIKEMDGFYNKKQKSKSHIVADNKIIELIQKVYYREYKNFHILIDHKIRIWK